MNKPAFFICLKLVEVLSFSGHGPLVLGSAEAREGPNEKSVRKSVRAVWCGSDRTRVVRAFSR
jgi:hypothetical protein